jgi:serine/threonine protein kinase
MVHRDIKPENILVHERAYKEGFAAEGVIKVTDFGLGKAMTTTTMGSIAYSQSMDSPASREIAGTLDYMPPEQRSGSEVDPRADLYACGVVLYELLTGERPAGTDLPSEINKAVPKSLDEAFRRSFTRLDKRFASAKDFLAALSPAMPPPMPNISTLPRRETIPPIPPLKQGIPPIPGLPPIPSRTNCPQCRSAVDAGDQYCMSCGLQLVENVRRCPQCGAYPDATDQYCIFCGQTLAPHATHVHGR